MRLTLSKNLSLFGKGGQKLHKSASTVYLKPQPSGLDIKCQESGSREENRFQDLIYHVTPSTIGHLKLASTNGNKNAGEQLLAIPAVQQLAYAYIMIYIDANL